MYDAVHSALIALKCVRRRNEALLLQRLAAFSISAMALIIQTARAKLLAVLDRDVTLARQETRE